MTKKAKAQKSENEIVVDTPTQVKIKKEPKPTPKDTGWVIKDRVYALKDGLAPLTYTIKSSNIYYFDEEKGYERELKIYCKSKNTFCR